MNKITFLNVLEAKKNKDDSLITKFTLERIFQDLGKNLFMFLCEEESTQGFKNFLSHTNHEGSLMATVNCNYNQSPRFAFFVSGLTVDDANDMQATPKIGAIARYQFRDDLFTCHGVGIIGSGAIKEHFIPSISQFVNFKNLEYSAPSNHIEGFVLNK